MEKIIKLGLVAGLLYLGFTMGRPYIEGLIDTPAVGGSGGGQCSSQINRARDNFADKMRDVTPPVNIERWNSGFAMSRGRVEQARDSCNCEGEGCAAGRDAVDALERLMREWDDSLQRSGAPPLNGARGLERVDRLIGEAREKGA